jgi:hypothetical protein
MGEAESERGVMRAGVGAGSILDANNTRPQDGRTPAGRQTPTTPRRMLARALQALQLAVV